MSDEMMTKEFKKEKSRKERSEAGYDFFMPHRLLFMMRSSAFNRRLQRGAGYNPFDSWKIYRDVHYLMDRIRRHE